MERRRVVITGIGTINPLGHNIEEYFSALENGVCGVDFIRKYAHVNGVFNPELHQYLQIHIALNIHKFTL